MTDTASRRSILVGGVAATVCGLAGCLSGGRDVEETVTETYTADELTAVAVSTASGKVDVRTTAEDTIDIEGRKAAISREDLELVGLTTRTDEGVLELIVERDESRTVFGLRPDPILDLSLAVPRALEVRSIETDDGLVDAADVRGDLSVTTATGDVNLRNVDGTVSVATDAGSVEIVDPGSIDRLVTDTGDVLASLPGIDNDATIETTAGAVELRLPDRLDLTLEISTETGTIAITDIEDLPELTGDSVIEAVVGDGTHRLEITTETGDVTVRGRGE